MISNEVFDDLLRIKRYPSKLDIKDLPQILGSNNFTTEQKKRVIDHTVKNWIKSQEKINLNNKINIFKTHNMLCNINLDGKILLDIGGGNAGIGFYFYKELNQSFF